MAESTGPSGLKDCDLVVRNGYVVTLDEARTIYRTGAVAIDGRTIAAVGAERDVLAAFRPRRVIDAHGAPVHPGFIDAHNHIVHQSCRGVFVDTMASDSQPVSFADWKADAHDEDEHAAAALAGVEMLRGGFTTFIEPGTAFSTDAVAAAAEAVGVRGAVTEPYLWDQVEIMEYAGGLRSDRLMGRAPPSTERCLELMGGELYRNKDPDALVTGYVSLYGEGTASDELERAAAAFARKNGVVFQQHEGYLPSIAKVHRENYGHSRITHLAELGVLDDNTTLIHMYALFDEDEDTIVDSGLSIVWCPFVYLVLAISGDARCRMPALHARGVNTALATDGALDCTIGVAAEAAHMVARNAHTPLATTAILEMLSIEAARASGLGARIGSLEVGKRADVVIRSVTAAESQPGFNPVHQLALQARAGSVDTVIVDGRIVLKGGQPTRVDAGEIYRAALASVHRRVERLGLGTPNPWPVVE